jgi:hypothetical protein
MAAFFTGLGVLGLTLAGIGLRRDRVCGGGGRARSASAWRSARTVDGVVVGRPRGGGAGGVGTAVGLALWVVAVLVMKVAPVQTSGVANINSISRTSIHWRCWRLRRYGDGRRGAPTCPRARRAWIR